MLREAETIDIDLPLLRVIGGIADERGLEAYVVGGYVRDRLLGREDADVDVMVVGDGVAFARAAAAALGRSGVVAFEEFGTAIVPLERGKVEFVGARSEQYRNGSRNPEVRAGTLQEDLTRRDFTVNAMAVSLNAGRLGTLLDPLGGQADLRRRLLRTPLDPSRTFEDDPLRIMRAARFASQLDFSIDEQALKAMGGMAERLKIVSQERITEEFLKIVGSPSPSVGLKLLFQTGVLRIVFPEVAQLAGVDQRKDHHHKDVFLHTCIVVDNVARASTNLWLRFTALMHDIAKPRTKAYKEGIGWTFHGHEELGARMMRRIFQRMKLPLDPLPYVEKLIRLHLRPMVLVDDAITDSAVRRLIFDAGDAIDDLMILCRADITSKNPHLVAKYLKNYDLVVRKIAEVEERDRLRNWQPPVRGDEIMAMFGLPEGKPVGILKKAVEEAILDGIIPNEHGAAVEFLRSRKQEILGF